MDIQIFFCDIEGTFTSKSESRIEKLQFFQKQLLQLANKYPLIFSFITSGTIDYLEPYINEWKPYVTEPIYLGRQFFDNGFIDNEKIHHTKRLTKFEQIFSYIEYIKQTYHIHNIFLADDTSMNHELVYYFNKTLYNYPITYITKQKIDELENSYISSLDGIDGVSSCVQKIYKNTHIHQ